MLKSKKRMIFCAVMAVCLIASSVTAFASGYYESDESGGSVPPSSIDSITVSKEDVEIPEREHAAGEFTPDGNMTLVDDILQSGYFESVEKTEEVGNKQFLTVQSKNGNYFYLVIDRSGETENVYFLNLVDEADLLELTGDKAVIDERCSCKDKCAVGSINTDCSVCKVEMSECQGKEKEPVEEKPSETLKEETPEPAEKGNAAIGIAAVCLIAVVIGGAAFYIIRSRKNKPQVKGTTELDGYDYGEDDDYMEFEEENEEQ